MRSKKLRICKNRKIRKKQTEKKENKENKKKEDKEKKEEQRKKMQSAIINGQIFAASQHCMEELNRTTRQTTMLNQQAMENAMNFTNTAATQAANFSNMSTINAMNFNMGMPMGMF